MKLVMDTETALLVVSAFLRSAQSDSRCCCSGARATMPPPPPHRSIDARDREVLLWQPTRALSPYRRRIDAQPLSDDSSWFNPQATGPQTSFANRGICQILAIRGS